MTPEEVKSCYNERFCLIGEQVVDVNIYEGQPFVDVVTVSKNHVLWLHEYEIVNKTLAWLGSYLMTAVREATA